VIVPQLAMLLGSGSTESTVVFPNAWKCPASRLPNHGSMFRADRSGSRDGSFSFELHLPLSELATK
jgi:hypothetical protein